MDVRHGRAGSHPQRPYLEAGRTLTEFLDDFPTVTREQAVPPSSSPGFCWWPMPVLLDEWLPRRLKRAFPGHAVRTGADRGCAGRKNGDLLRLAAERFDVFITVDRGIEHEHNLASVALGSVLLAARSNDIDDLLPRIPGIHEVLPDVRPGQVRRVGGA